jgi:hypothetical protein
MVHIIFLIGILLIIFTSLSAFNFIFGKRITIFPGREASCLSQSPNEDVVENGVSMVVLKNHVADGQYVGEMITKFLNEEWIELDVHDRVGTFITDVYIAAREQGISDLGELLLLIGTKLESFDLSDAFVNSWDIANKTADLLMLRMDRELCACSDFNRDDQGIGKIERDRDNNTNKIIIGTQTEKDMIDIGMGVLKSSHEVNEAIVNLKSEFNRYKFLQEFLDREISWEEMNIPVAVVLGFRMNSDGQFLRDNNLTPYRWAVSESSLKSKSFSPIDTCPSVLDSDFMSRLKLDLPEDESSTDILIDQITGAEMHRIMKINSNIEDIHRIVVVKWLYVHNFLGRHFPALERFTPLHLNDDE